MQPRDILETCLYVSDLAAAERFYASILGLRLHSRQEERHLFFYCGSRMLLLFKPDRSSEAGSEIPPHGATGAGHIAFAAREEDLPAWRKHLETHGVPIERIIAWPGGGHSIYFRDPSGNSLEIATPKIWGLPEA